MMLNGFFLRFFIYKWTFSRRNVIIANTIFPFLLFWQESDYCVVVGREIFANNNSKQKQIIHKIDTLMHNLGRISNVTRMILEIGIFHCHDPVLRSYNLWQDSETPCPCLLPGLVTGDLETPPSLLPLAPSQTSRPDMIHLTLCRL